MQCYAEILSPSGITHSVAVSFTAADAKNLVVARTSLLQIFDIVQTDENAEAKLVLIAEQHLQGTISDLNKVKSQSTESGGDALIIAFRDAKLSLIEWSPSLHSISTISIHYYENNDLSLSPWSPDLANCPTHLTVDPSSRCAAFNFGINNLAIIPFHQAGDDLEIDHLDDIDEQTNGNSTTKDTNGEASKEELPYSPSFVLPLTALDPELLHPVALTFLHEYGKPTLGVLYSSSAQSTNLDPVRKDVMVYAVYTLDLAQKASTTLLSVQKLPNDLHSVMPVPAPIGGALLLGGNEVLHIDQGGKVNAIAVNEFTKDSSSYPMADQSDLNLKLEGSRAQILSKSSTDILIVAKEGAFVILTFRLDGRSVSGATLSVVNPASTSGIFHNTCSDITLIEPSSIFLACEEADSVLVHVAKKTNQLKRQTSRAFFDDTNGDLELDDDDEMDEDDDDDLYGETAVNGHTTQTSSFDASSLIVCDRLPVIGPIHDMALGRAVATNENGDTLETKPQTTSDRLDLVLAHGQGKSGSLAFMSRSIKPQIAQTIQTDAVDALWALSNEAFEEGTDARPFDTVLVTSKVTEDEGTVSALYDFIGGDLNDMDADDFQKDDKAICAGRLATGSHVVVYRKEIRAYNQEFGLDQIFPIMDEEDDPTARAAAILDRHILVIKDDDSISLLKADKSGDLDEIDLPDSVPSEDIVFACLYDSKDDFFQIARYDGSSRGVLAVLTKEGLLSLHPLKKLDIQIFQYRGLDFLPPHLANDMPVPKHWRDKDTLLEFTLADLGDGVHTKPYLIVRNSVSDITLYEPYRTPNVAGAFRFIKLFCRNGDPRQTEQTSLKDAARIVPMADVHGMSVVFITGSFPTIIAKPHFQTPDAYVLDIGPISHITSFHDSSCNRGFAYMNSHNTLYLCELPSDMYFSPSGWLTKHLPMGTTVTGLVYYQRTASYVLATSSPVPFHLPRDDEWHPEWESSHEKASDSFLPSTTASTLKLLSSTSHSVISQYHFEPNEQVLSIKCLHLEISEVTHERKPMIVVGTGITKGENVVTRGNIYIFDVVDVVPQPDIPETDLKLKLITKEDVRGAVTSLSDIGTQGFLIAAQGQKCMVRGLREDNAILPVAFMDMRFHVSVTKELRGTGLTILGDAFSGLWLMGYSEEPYKMQLLGRDLTNPSVVAAEFLPQDKQLYIVSSDANGNLRVLQYDPENPATERGSVLLQRSTFNTGSYPTTMTLLPRSFTPSEVASNTTSDPLSSPSSSPTPPPPANPTNPHQILLTTSTGSLALLLPVPESSYRRLSALQTLLTTQLDQPAGLNPRAHRAVETDGLGGRGIVDGEVVKRWLGLASQMKANLADRVGGGVWEIRADLELLGGGLGFL